MGRPPSLTLSQKKKAIRRRTQGATLDELARSYNVSRATIRAFLRCYEDIQFTVMPTSRPTPKTSPANLRANMTDDTKAKHAKRRKDDPEPWVKAPKGAYNSGIYDQYILMRLGAVCGIWTHIEEAMIDFFSFLLGDTGGAARPVLRSIVNQEARIKVMRGVLENTWDTVNLSEACDDLLDEFRKVTTLRNRYVHGLWFTHQDGKIYLRSPSVDHWDFSDTRRVTTKELDNFIARLYSLYEKARNLPDAERKRPKPDRTDASVASVRFGDRVITWQRTPPKLPDGPGQGFPPLPTARYNP